MQNNDQLMRIFSPVVQIATNFGAIVFAIWLLILGRWLLIVSGIVAVLGCVLVLKFALALQTLFALPLPALARKGRRLVIYFLVFVSQAYAALLMTIWCVGVFSWFLSTGRDNLAPALGFSYAVAIGPWTYLVWLFEINSSGEIPPSFILTFFACLGYIALVLVFIIWQTILAYVIFLVFIVIGLLVQYVFSLNEIDALLRS